MVSPDFYLYFCSTYNSDMDPSIAKKVASGDVDPVTLLPMEDINSTFVPRVPLKSNILNYSKEDKGKEKARTPGKSVSEGILHFFGVYMQSHLYIRVKMLNYLQIAAPKPKVASAPKSSSQPVKSSMVVGKASGKRTLADVMDQDIAAKKKKREQSLTPQKSKSKVLTESRFFGVRTPTTSPPEDIGDAAMPIAGPSYIREFGNEDKENAPISDDEDLEFAMNEDLVTQEDGYISPSPPSFSRSDTPDLSSPPRPETTRKKHFGDNLDDFGVEAISSPIAHRIAPHPQRSRSLEKPDWSEGEVLVRDTPAPSDQGEECSVAARNGPDLRDMFGDDLTSEIDCFEEEDTLDPTPPTTPDDSVEMKVDLADEVDLEPEELEASAVVTRTAVVANGWWQKWGHAGKDMEGRHRVCISRLRNCKFTKTDA